MTYFHNPLFMATLIRRQGVEGYFQKSDAAAMLIYVEMETRLLIETAIKYMRKSRRTKLEKEDIDLAAQHIGHEDLVLLPLFRRILSENQIHISKLAKSCGFSLSNRIEQGRLKGQMLLKEGKLCNEFSNRPIRQLRKDQLYSSKEQRGGNFNFISFNEQQLLSVQEVNYLTKFELILLANKYKVIKGIDGNVMKMFSMYLSLARQFPNEAGIRVIEELIEHPKVSKSALEYNLLRVLEVLLVYRGTWAYRVGINIVKIVNIYLKQHPALLNLMEVSNNDYSYILKAIAFQEYFKVDSIQYKLQKIIHLALKESSQGNNMAMLCLNTIIQKATHLQAFYKQKVPFPFWIPNQWIKNDRYLSSF